MGGFTSYFGHYALFASIMGTGFMFIRLMKANIIEKAHIDEECSTQKESVRA